MNDPFRLKRKEDVESGLRRILREQLDAAIGQLEDHSTNRHEAVHEARKHLKKIRGVLRILRNKLGWRFEFENTFFRDCGRSLSALRDAEAIVESFDKLRDGAPHALDDALFDTAREALIRRRQRIADDEVGLEKTAAEVALKLREARERVDSWPFSGKGFGAFRKGFVRMYRQGRQAMHRALEKPSPANFHEWRKRAKYHWYHARLLRHSWPNVLKVYCDNLEQLSELLGDDHDLEVLRQIVEAAPEEFGGEYGAAILITQIVRRRQELESAAMQLGCRIYGESAKALGRRFEIYWDCWRVD